MHEPVRVVIGEDDVLIREGIARLLAEAGFEVAAQAGDAERSCARRSRTIGRGGRRRPDAAGPHR